MFLEKQKIQPQLFDTLYIILPYDIKDLDIMITKS